MAQPKIRSRVRCPFVKGASSAALSAVGVVTRPTARN
jgi:hypothetical protein